MIGYILGGAFIVGAGVAVAQKIYERKLCKDSEEIYKKFEEVCAENERLHNQFTKEGIKTLAYSLKDNLTDEELDQFQRRIENQIESNKKQVEMNNNLLNENKNLVSRL